MINEGQAGFKSSILVLIPVSLKNSYREDSNRRILKLPYPYILKQGQFSLVMSLMMDSKLQRSC